MSKKLDKLCLHLKKKKKIASRFIQKRSSHWLRGCDEHPCPLSLQSKKRFEREWREAERAAQYAEKTDQDINATKADVEKVTEAN